MQLEYCYNSYNPKPINSLFNVAHGKHFSVCNIEKLEMGLGTRLAINLAMASSSGPLAAFQCCTLVICEIKNSLCMWEDQTKSTATKIKDSN